MKLIELADLLEKNPNNPSKIFGKVTSTDELDKVYRKFAVICHPDKYTQSREKIVANAAFIRLGEILRKAEQQLTANSYGKDFQEAKPTIIKSPKNSYEVKGLISKAMYANLYDAGNSIIKITRDQKENKFTENEATILGILDKNIKENGKKYYANLQESFRVNYQTKLLSANVFPDFKHLYSLERIRKSSKYKEGIGPISAAWMFNRILEGISYFHDAGIIHGGILPCNLYIDVKTHGIKIIEFSHSVKNGEKSKDFMPYYWDMHPPEALSEEIMSPTSDIYMAAKVMEYILGTPEDFPTINRFLTACTIHNPNRRVDCALEARSEFGDIAFKLFGKPKFVEFDVDGI